MTKYAMAVDMKRCMGCNMCSMSCRVEHNLPNGVVYNRAITEGGEGFRVAGGAYPDTLTMKFYTLSCDNPGCVSVCPTGATYKREEDGLVLVNAENCIGCGSCLTGCPYGVRSLNPNTNVVEKCTLCSHKVHDELGWEPACVHNCCCGARYFGDLDDPESSVSKAVAAAGEENCHKIYDPGSLEPSTIYILSAKTAAWQDEPVEVDRYEK